MALQPSDLGSASALPCPVLFCKLLSDAGVADQIISAISNSEIYGHDHVYSS